MSVKMVLLVSFILGWALPCCGNSQNVPIEQVARDIVQNLSCDQRNQLIKVLKKEYAFTGEPSFLTIATLMVVIIGGSQALFWFVRESTKPLEPTEK